MISRVLFRRLLVLPVLCAALAACGDDDDTTGTGGGSFTLGTPASAAVTVQAGQATTVTIPVTFTGSMRAVTLSADSVPAGIRVGFQPSVISNGTEQVTVSITANPDMAAGTRTIRIIARAPDMQDQVTRIAITTTRAPSYTLTNPTTTAAPLTIQRTQSGTVTVTLDRSGGFTGPVDVYAEGLPAGVTVAPVMNVTGNTVTLTVNTAANASAVAGSFTVRAVNPTTGDRVTTVRYRILAEPGVQIASTAKTVQQGGPDTVYVSVNREGGFTGPVTVTLTDLPAGITAAPVTSDAGSTVAVPLTIASTAAVGTSNITVSVSGSNIATKTVTPALTVRSGTLTSGTAVTAADPRPRGSRLHWTINVPAGATRLLVTFQGGTGDGDLYIFSPSGALLCAEENVDNAETCTIANPVAGVYRIRVEVWNPYAGATLRATVTQ